MLTKHNFLVRSKSINTNKKFQNNGIRRLGEKRGKNFGKKKRKEKRELTIKKIKQNEK
jgi:hypothetical protein